MFYEKRGVYVLLQVPFKTPAANILVNYTSKRSSYFLIETVVTFYCEQDTTYCMEQSPS
jgi:hypothetical protein